MINKLSNNWTVLSNEEMNHVTGGMEGDEPDPTTFAAQSPDDFMEMWQDDPQMMFHWFHEAGYNRRQTMRFMRSFFRSYGRNRGGC